MALSCRAGGADQCPKLGVERTQRGHAATTESDVVDGCAGRPAKGRRWKSVTVKE